MATHTRQELAAINKQRKALLLEKTGAKHRDIVDLAEQRFIKANLDILTEDEKRQFDLLILE